MGDSSRLTTAFFVLAVICLFGLGAHAVTAYVKVTTDKSVYQDQVGDRRRASQSIIVITFDGNYINVNERS